MNKDKKQNETVEKQNETTSIIYGRNTVLEALKSKQPIDKVLVLKGETQGSIKQIMAKAKDLHIPIVFAERIKMDKMCEKANHQGVIAYVSIANYVEVSDIIKVATDKGENPFVVVLDELTDTMNVGAIIRTAECSGAHGVIVAKRRSAAMNTTVAKSSSGAACYMPIAQVTNIAKTLELLKEKGLWIVGADMSGDDIYKTDLKGPLAVVIGGEGKGIGPLVKKNCDFLVRIPMKGQVKSLNASVAAGVVLYEKVRQELM